MDRISKDYILWEFESKHVFLLKPHVADGVCGFSFVLELVLPALRHLVHDVVVAGEVEPRDLNYWYARTLVIGNLRLRIAYHLLRSTCDARLSRFSSLFCKKAVKAYDI